MRILNMERGFGKTDTLIKTSISTGYPIIVATLVEKNRILSEMERLGFKNSLVYTVNEWMMYGSHGRHNESILIDNLDSMLPKILNDYFGCDVATCTITQEMHNVRPKK